MNCEVCGKRMYHFKDPDRYLCRTSDGEHERIRRATRRVENISDAVLQHAVENPDMYTKRRRNGGKFS